MFIPSQFSDSYRFHHPYSGDKYLIKISVTGPEFPDLAQIIEYDHKRQGHRVIAIHDEQAKRDILRRIKEKEDSKRLTVAQRL